MKRTLLTFLFLLASPTLAAELSLPVTNAAAGSEFAVPVIVELGNEYANAIEGKVILPDGVTFVSLDTAGSALPVWADGPHYVIADNAVEFTGGTSGSVSGTIRVLTLHLRADNPGTYTLLPTEFFAYRNDGKGTRVTIATSDVDIDVGAAGTKTAANPNVPTQAAVPTKLQAQIGTDPAIAGGKYFVAFTGGGDASGINHYEIQQAWWGRGVRVPASPAYFVLPSQDLGTSVRVTAVSNDGVRETLALHTTHEWPERFTVVPIWGLTMVAIFGITLIARKRR